MFNQYVELVECVLTESENLKKARKEFASLYKGQNASSVYAAIGNNLGLSVKYIENDGEIRKIKKQRDQRKPTSKKTDDVDTSKDGAESSSYSMSDIKDLLTSLMDCEDMDEVRTLVKNFTPGIFESKKTSEFSMSDVKDFLTSVMDCEDIEEVQALVKNFAPGIF